MHMHFGCSSVAILYHVHYVLVRSGTGHCAEIEADAKFTEARVFVIFKHVVTVYPYENILIYLKKRCLQSLSVLFGSLRSAQMHISETLQQLSEMTYLLERKCFCVV
jgi:hypothetical protein